MVFDDVVLLIRQRDERTENGFNEPRERERKVFAKFDDPMRTEFYAAAQAGYRISGSFTVNTDEYHGEQLVEFKGKRFSVVRSYPIDRVFTKLIVSEVL